eukprot:gene8752-700_t
MNLLFAVVLVLCIQLSVQSTDDKPAKVNRIFSEYNQKGYSGATVSVIQNGKFLFQNSFGNSEIRHEQKNKNDTKYIIASITKQFTCLAIAILEHEGKLSAKDSVKKYVPDFKFPNITISNLIHHTSGLKEYLVLLTIRGDGGLFAVDREYSWELIKKQNSLGFKTGESWSYCNTGYLILELVIESVTKMKYHEFMKKRIFEPLGMKNTQIFMSPGKPEKNFAYGYEKLSNGQMMYKPLLTQRLGGSGGIQTTHEDFLKFDSNFYDNKLPEFNNGTSHNYAWGLFISEQYGHKIIAHAGGFPGYASQFIRIPEKKMTIFVTANIADGKIQKKAFEVSQVFLDKKLKDIHRIDQNEIKIEVDIETSFKIDPSFYVGYYYQNEIEVAHRLYSKKGNLFMNIKNLGEIQIVLKENHEFTFLQNVNGKFLIQNGQVVGMHFINLPGHEEKISCKELLELLKSIQINTEEKYLEALANYFSPLEKEPKFINFLDFSEWYFSFSSKNFENFEETLQFLFYFNEIFSKHDQDNSQTLSRDELKPLLEELLEEEVFLKNMKKNISLSDWIDHFDENGDGLIDFKEFSDGLFSTDINLLNEDVLTSEFFALENGEVEDGYSIILESSFGHFIFLPKYGKTSLTTIKSKEVVFQVEKNQRSNAIKLKKNNRYMSMNDGTDEFFLERIGNFFHIRFDDKLLSANEVGFFNFEMEDVTDRTKWKIIKIKDENNMIKEKIDPGISKEQKLFEDYFFDGRYQNCFEICETNLQTSSIFSAYLGVLYFNGYGCEKNYSKAKEYFEKSMDEVPLAATFLGEIYFSGLDEEKNMDLAYQYFLKSKVGGNVNNANYMIGHLFFEEENYKKSIEYFTIASKNDHVDSLLMLKKMYSEGIGTKKDSQMADDIDETIKSLSQSKKELNSISVNKFKEEVKTMEKIVSKCSMSANNYKEIIDNMNKKIHQLEENHQRLKLQVDDHENRLGYMESKIEEFQSQIHSIKKKMKKQKESRIEFEKNISTIIEDLQSKMSKIDAIDDIQNDLKILLSEREEMKKKKEIMDFIENTPELKAFHDRVQSKLTEVFLAAKVISSGSVERKQTSGEFAIQMVTETFSSVCFVLGKGALKTIANGATFGLFSLVDIPDQAFSFLGAGAMAVGKIAYKVEETRQDNKIKTINNLIPSVSKLDKICEDVARMLTLRYQDQIMECTIKKESLLTTVGAKTDLSVSWQDGGAEHLGEAAAARMFDALFSGNIKYFKDITTQLVDSVFFGSAGLWNIPFPIFGIGNTAMITTKKKKKWTDTGVFCKSGIMLNQEKEKFFFRGFDKICSNPKLFGYRNGTNEEIKELGLVQGVNESPLASQNPLLNENTMTKKRGLRKTLNLSNTKIKDSIEWNEDKMIKMIDESFKIPQEFDSFTFGVSHETNSVSLSAFVYDALGSLEDYSICEEYPEHSNALIEWKDFVAGCNEVISISRGTSMVKIVVCFEILNSEDVEKVLDFHLFSETTEICSFKMNTKNKEIVTPLISFQYENGNWSMSFEEEEFSYANDLYEGNYLSDEEIINPTKIIENRPKNLFVSCLRGKYLNTLEDKDLKDQYIEVKFNGQSLKTTKPENKQKSDSFKKTKMLFSSTPDELPITFEPQWNQLLKFSLEKMPLDNSLSINVFNQKLFSDRKLGTLVLDLENLSFFQDLWIDLKNDTNMNCDERAQILIRISF